jgi:hypothetical protein
MTQKQFEVICKNMIAAGMYLVYDGGSSIGNYDILDIVVNKTIISKNDVNIFSEEDNATPLTKTYIYAHDLTSKAYFEDVTAKRNPFMMDSYGYLILVVKLNEKYSFCFQFNHGEDFPDDNGIFYLIDNIKNIIYSLSASNQLIEYSNGKTTSINNISWSAIYGQISYFFASKDLISLVNYHIPGYVL